MKLAWEHAPTSLFFGAQPGNETFLKNWVFSADWRAFLDASPVRVICLNPMERFLFMLGKICIPGKVCFLATLIFSLSLPVHATSWTYPPARRDTLVENYHGTSVADPYRWLEDPAHPDTETWVKAQNRLTQDFLKSVPDRALILKRLETLQNYPRTGVPFKAGKRYAFWKNNGLQNQSVLYLQDDLDAPARLLLDPNTLSKDGTVAVSNTHFSKDGSLMAYAISRSGSDWARGQNPRRANRQRFSRNPNRSEVFGHRLEK